MKSKIVTILFVIVALILGASFFLAKHFSNNTETVASRAKVITPKPLDDEAADSDTSYKNTFQAEQFDTFIDLLPSETLINSLTIDLNNDGLDDEVIVVRKTGEPYFSIIPGIYNPDTNVYERLKEIPTKISKTRTFSIFGFSNENLHY